MTPEYYSNIAPYYSELQSLSREYETETHFLCKIIRSLPAQNCIELGCGTGEYSKHFQEKNMSLDGIDASPGMIRVAREQNPTDTFYIGMYDAFPNDMYSVIIASYSFIDFCETKTALDDFFSRMAAKKPRYILVDTRNYAHGFTFPNTGDILERVGKTLISRVMIEEVTKGERDAAWTFSHSITDIENGDTVHISASATLGFHAPDTILSAASPYFTCEKTYGDYSGNTFNADTSPRFIAIFERK